MIVSDEENTLDFELNKPKLMTYQNSKGMQFEAIFLPEYNCSKDDERELLYIAMTRSYQSLYITHKGDLSVFFKTSLQTNIIQV